MLNNESMKRSPILFKVQELNDDDTAAILHLTQIKNLLISYETRKFENSFFFFFIYTFFIV